MKANSDPLCIVAHPVRLRILAELGRAQASPNEIAVATDLPLGTVAYHVRTMADHGALVLTGTVPVRGAIEHFYRATPEAGSMLAQLKGLTQLAAKRAPKP